MYISLGLVCTCTVASFSPIAIGCTYESLIKVPIMHADFYAHDNSNDDNQHTNLIQHFIPHGKCDIVCNAVHVCICTVPANTVT